MAVHLIPFEADHQKHSVATPSAAASDVIDTEGYALEPRLRWSTTRDTLGLAARNHMEGPRSTQPRHRAIVGERDDLKLVVTRSKRQDHLE